MLQYAEVFHGSAGFLVIDILHGNGKGAEVDEAREGRRT